MAALRSARFSAALLLLAAVAGLALANTALGPALLGAKATHLDLPLIGVRLSLGHWVSDGLLAVFFFLVAVELRRELVIGELRSVRRAVLPAIAALGGVILPALIFLLVTGGSGFENGWPIPTATDIAFALGILAIFGPAIPTRVRVFLLALAVLDDLVAIVVIAVFFTTDVQLPYLGFAGAALVVFGALSRLLAPRSAWVLARRRQWPIVLALCLLAGATWYFVLLSGVHATIAGVALGFVIARHPGGRSAHLLEPISNGVILPLFAFSAALVVVPQVGIAGLSPVFWAILAALPLGKFLGISLAGLVGNAIVRPPEGHRLEPRDLLTVGTVGGVGFTVSLLMNELAFSADPAIADQGVLAVLLGSSIAIVAGSVAVAAASRSYRRRSVQKHQ